MKIFILFVIFSVIVLDAFGQISKQKESWMSEEFPANEKLALANEFKSWRSRQTTRISSADAEIWTIPVVFHVMTTGLPALATFENAVNELNDAFANRGVFNTPQGADTRIQFCLASTAPDGGSTTGVNHIPSDYQNTDMDLDNTELVRQSKWDVTRYLNIWLVNDVTGEALAYYEGKNWWTRLGVNGYASGDGIVVAGLSPSLLTHEIGHYFGLLHTWAGRDCKNDDCLLDGDMVCDTPPDKSTAVPCGDNSCDTDILSDFSNQTFFTDVKDMSTNFMDYSPCPLDFTWGQAERMRFTLESRFPGLFSRGISHPLCELPCGNDIAVQFYLDNQYPKPGQNVKFTSGLKGNKISPIYKWFVKPFNGDWTKSSDAGNLVSSASDLTYSFPGEGWYTITLQVWDTGNNSCFASFSRNVEVSCGVDSRFFPDKRLIASKQPHALFTDSVFFTNRSHGASSYEWVILHQNFNSVYENLPRFTSSSTDLSYYFKEPGNYEISLIARNGNCENVSNSFFLTVDDPTIDGSPEISKVTCINEDTFQIEFTLHNYGYDTVNVNTPVAFYDANPSQSADAQLIGLWKLPKVVYGFDKEDFSATVNGDIRKLSAIYLVFNDSGTTNLPLQFPPGDLNQLSKYTVFPPSNYSELAYDNNISSFPVSLEITSSVFLAYELDLPTCSGNSDGVIRISASGGSGTYKYIWSHDPLLNADTASGLIAGIYTVEVSDVSSCAFETLEVSLDDSSPMQVSFSQKSPSCPIKSDGELSIEVSGGSGPFTYLWEDGSTSNALSGIPSGKFEITITDSRGCILLAIGEVESTAPKVRMPTGFVPKDGPYLPISDCEITFQLIIWNRWGQMVHSGSEGWDGNIAGVESLVGSYSSLLHYQYIQNGITQTNKLMVSFTLIR